MPRTTLPENFWERVLATLEIELDKSVVATWLNKTKLFETQEKKLIVTCHDSYAATIIAKRYATRITQIVLELTGQKYKVAFVTHPQDALVNPTTQEKDASVRGPLFDQLNQRESAARAQNQAMPGPAAASARPGRILNKSYTFDNFVVGNTNRVAHAAAMSVIENPGGVYNPLLIYGGTGVGKTHLLLSIGNELLSKNPSFKVLYFSGEQFINDFVEHIRRKKDMQSFRALYRQSDALLVDDVQFIAGKESTQEEFYHTYNELYQTSRQIVLASDRDPAEISGLADRLTSRLKGGLMVNVGKPDYETRLAILATKAISLNMPMDAPMYEFVANLNINNVRELEGILLKIKSAALAQNEPISLPLIKSVLVENTKTGSTLTGGSSTPARKISPEIILNLVTETFDISFKDLCGKRRQSSIVLPRQMAMFLLRNEIGMNLEDIGKVLGGRDHTTIMHGCGKINLAITQQNNTYLKSQLKFIREKLYT